MDNGIILPGADGRSGNPIGQVYLWVWQGRVISFGASNVSGLSRSHRGAHRLSNIVANLLYSESLGARRDYALNQYMNYRYISMQVTTYSTINDEQQPVTCVMADQRSSQSSRIRHRCRRHRRKAPKVSGFGSGYMSLRGMTNLLKSVRDGLEAFGDGRQVCMRS